MSRYVSYICIYIYMYVDFSKVYLQERKNSTTTNIVYCSPCVKTQGLLNAQFGCNLSSDLSIG